MSHFSKIKTGFKDRAILEQSIAQLQAEQNLGSNVSITFPNQDDNQLESKTAIHFKWSGESFDVITDLHYWQANISTELFLQKLRQAYAENLITQMVNSKGGNFIEKNQLCEGSVKLRFRYWK